MARRQSSSSVLSAGLLILALVVAMFVWQPASQSVDQLESNLDNKEAELMKLEAQIAELMSMDERLPVAESERELILRAVPEELAQDELVRDLEAIAEGAQMDLGSMSFSLQPAVEGANVVSIVANFAGRYEDLLSLLMALEKNERLFYVTSIGVQLSEVSDAGDQLMNFSVTLEAFYQ